MLKPDIMERVYEERQLAWYLIVLFDSIFLLLLLAYFYEWGNHPISLIGLSVYAVIYLLIAALFYQMKTQVTLTKIIVSFGIGWITKSINIEKLESVKVVRNNWYDGLGIKVIKNGMLYNIQGLDAIELKFKNKKNIIRIGSSDPERLKQEIDSMLK